jgi:hypothetical protein
VSNKKLLLEIQKEAVDSNTRLSTVLRKCLVLATGLGHRELKEWAHWELNGYPESSELPDYRLLKGLQSYGDFFGFAGSGLKNAPVSVLGLPEQVRDSFSNRRVWQGVEEIAEMARSQHDKVIRLAWPAEAYRVYKNQDYREDFQLAVAWTFLPVSHLVGLLDTIRNRVLTFALEMKTLDLKLEEEVSSAGSNKATNAQITQIFHQTIHGPVSNVGTAGSISQTMIDNRGDLAALKARLRRQDYQNQIFRNWKRRSKQTRENKEPRSIISGRALVNGWVRPSKNRQRD